MNDLQQKKFARLFAILDRDHDDAVERSDYEAIGMQVATLRGLAVGSPEQAQMAARMGAYWDALAQRADKDANGRVTRSEWAKSMGSGSESMAQTRGQMVGLAAALLDRDGDGLIASADYQRLIELVGYKLANGDEVFRRLDRNGDGKIDTAELGTLVDEFLFSDDPEAPGNWLLGNL
jgi:Ca2+-binding EF-hand superfamily protein